MNLIWMYSILSVLLVSAVSFVGIFGMIMSAKKLNSALIYLVSFSTGALFGDAFVHLLPEAAKERGFGLSVSLSVLAGIIIFFALEKIIHWKHCHSTECKYHGEMHRRKRFVYLFCFGDGLHNLIDGMIIAASFIASVPVGIATTIAVVLHEIPQEVGDFAILVHGGFSRFKALMVNFLIGLIAVLGAAITLWFGSHVNGLTNLLIPVAAGGFIYIAGSDLIPELHREANAMRSILQFACIVAGILVMMGLLWIG